VRVIALFLTPMKRRVVGVRRIVLRMGALGACAVAMLLVSSLALAATVRCSGNYDNPCLGTNEDDVIRGTAKPDQVLARGGSDVIYLGGESDWVAGDQKGPLSYEFPSRSQGEDIIYGGRSRDFMYGDGGDDILYGNSGDDYLHGDSLVGNQGDDILYGGEGEDTLDDGTGEDLLYGGDGDDRFFVGKDGVRDHLYCGDGYDTYRPPDTSDYVSPTCEEQVSVQSPSPPIP
jgi:Ca2+-binding RTX toxin-like protein